MFDKLKQLPELAALPLLILVGIVFFMLTNPKNLPPAALMIGFAILAGIIYSIVRLVGYVAGLQERMRPGRYKLFLVIATALPVLLIALQSLGQLTVRDTLTIAVLFLAGGLYASRVAA